MQLEKPIYLSDLEIKREYTTKSFKDAIYETFGVNIAPKEDGTIHRFSTRGDKSFDGWYIVNQLDNNLSFATYGTWRDIDNKYTWCSKGEITPTEREFLRIKQEEHEVERKEIQKKAALEAKDIYERSAIAKDHPYLLGKGINNADGIAKIDSKGKTLILPIYCYSEVGTKEIISIQFIQEDGSKSFKKDCSTSGGFLEIGKPNGTTFLCEGFATGMSIHKATNCHVVVAFNAGNLPKVATHFPSSIIVADNDSSGVGEKYALQSGLPYILIPTLGMDANDYAAKFGKAELSTLLTPYVAPVKEEWIIHGREDIKEQKNVDWLIDEWLEVGGFTMMHSQPGAGKSFIALDMLLSISSGKGNWKGYDAKQGCVLYLCGEGFSGIPSRLKAWMQENDSDIGKFFRCTYPIPLNEADSQFALEQIDRMEEKPVLVCIDTLNRFYAGDENSAEEMSKLIAFVSTLKHRYGSATLLIHHTGASKENQDRARGSSTLKGAVETEISLSNLEGKTIQVIQKKQKNGELLDPIFLELKTVPIEGWFDDKNRPVKSAFPVLKKDADNLKIDDCFKEKNYFVLAFANSSKIMTRESNIFLSSQDFRKYLMSQNWSDADIKNALYRKEKSRLIPKLIDAGFIQESEYEAKKGWIVINSTLSQMCIISSQVKGGKNE